MNDARQFIDRFVELSRELGFRVENTRNGAQIDFGNKKLHAGHLSKLFPMILSPGANVAQLINSVAAGRPCTHRPTRQIIALMSR